MCVCVCVCVYLCEYVCMYVRQRDTVNVCVFLSLCLCVCVDGGLGGWRNDQTIQALGRSLSQLICMMEPPHISLTALYLLNATVSSATSLLNATVSCATSLLNATGSSATSLHF